MGSALLWIAVAVGLIGLAEIAVRAAAPRVARLLEWRDWECQHKAAALEKMARSGGASVVAIGASDVNAAFDPEQFSSRLRSARPAFNAALNAATMRTLELWTRDVVLPKLRPDLVVLGINSSLLNDHNPTGERGFRMFRNSLGWRRLRPDASLRQRLLLWVEEKSFLVRYRHYFREPARWGMHIPLLDRLRWFMSDLKRPFRRDRGAKLEVTPSGVLLALSVFRDSPYKIGEDRMVRSWVRILTDYDVNGHELAAMKRLVEAIHAAGAELLIVLPPVTQDWIDLHPQKEKDFEQFGRTMAAVAGEHKVPFLDLAREFASKDDYFDATHLNDKAVPRFNKILSDAAEDILAPRSSSRGER